MLSVTSSYLGTNPQYVWYLNGVIAGRTNVPTFVPTGVAGCYNYWVTLHSDDPCASPDSANSNLGGVLLKENQIPNIAITDKTPFACPGTAKTYEEQTYQAHR